MKMHHNAHGGAFFDDKYFESFATLFRFDAFTTTAIPYALDGQPLFTATFIATPTFHTL
jgi:hypothetical protein